MAVSTCKSGSSTILHVPTCLPCMQQDVAIIKYAIGVSPVR